MRKTHTRTTRHAYARTSSTRRTKKWRCPSRVAPMAAQTARSLGLPFASSRCSTSTRRRARCGSRCGFGLGGRICVWLGIRPNLAASRKRTCGLPPSQTIKTATSGCPTCSLTMPARPSRPPSSRRLHWSRAAAASTGRGRARSTFCASSAGSTAFPRTPRCAARSILAAGCCRAPTKASICSKTAQRCTTPSTARRSRPGPPMPNGRWAT